MGRKITVKKSDLIATVKKNMANHEQEYVEAVEAYKKEAKKQLDAQAKALKAGSLDIHLRLVKPVNKKDEYERILAMFEWEIADDVELTESEFKEYILDEAQFAVNAKMQNMTYRG